METGQAAGLAFFFLIFTKKLTSGTKEKGKLYKIKTAPKKQLTFIIIIYIIKMDISIA